MMKKACLTLILVFVGVIHVVYAAPTARKNYNPSNYTTPGQIVDPGSYDEEGHCIYARVVVVAPGMLEYQHQDRPDLAGQGMGKKKEKKSKAWEKFIGENPKKYCDEEDVKEEKQRVCEAWHKKKAERLQGMYDTLRLINDSQKGAEESALTGEFVKDVVITLSSVVGGALSAGLTAGAFVGVDYVSNEATYSDVVMSAASEQIAKKANDYAKILPGNQYTKTIAKAGFLRGMSLGFAANDTMIIVEHTTQKINQHNEQLDGIRMRIVNYAQSKCPLCNQR